MPWHSLLDDSFECQNWRQTDFWPSCSMDPSSPRSPDHPGGGGLQTGATHGWSLDWPYAFVCLSSTTHHVALSDVGHLGTMPDGVQSVNTCSHMHQLQTQKLLQHKEHVVFPAGLNGEPEACHFSFPELSPWDTVTTGRSTGELPTIEVTVGGTEGKSIPTIPPSLVSLAPASYGDTLGGKLPYDALGDPPPSQMKDPLSLEGMDPPSYILTATSFQGSLANTTPRDSSAIVKVSHSPYLSTASKSQGAASIPSDHQFQAPARAGPSNIPQEVAWLWKEMNAALGQLLTQKLPCTLPERS